jgi:hypothetical protein
VQVDQPPAGDGLARILEALERIERRLDRLERPSEAPGAGEHDHLRLRLEEVLCEVRAVQAERATIEGEWAEQRRLACDQELGRLRQRQARLLFELDELPLV